MVRPTGRRKFYSQRHQSSDNGPFSDTSGPHRLQNIRETAHLATFFLTALALGGCGSTEDSTVDSGDSAENSAASLLPDSSIDGSGCDEGGELYANLYGTLTGEIEWYLDEMQCQGMPRPNGAGARLRFSGTVGADALPITFIIGIPELRRETSGAELPSNVTVIEERNSRFFSTADLDTCWTDVEAQWAIDDSPDRYRIDGILYCISPLPEVNGEGSITMPELRFSGQLDWSAK